MEKSAHAHGVLGLGIISDYTLYQASNASI